MKTTLLLLALDIVVLAAKGDSHNFGKVVTFSKIDLNEFYFKPRTVFWEWFFFDKNSPVFTGLVENVKNGYQKNLIENIFQLEVIKNLNSGFSKAIKPISQQLINYNVAYSSAGALLAYTFIFGIEDLHSENVILSDAGFAIIDAESVLTKMLTPNETMLFPIREIPFDKTGFGLLFNINCTEELMEHFLKAYISIVEVFMSTDFEKHFKIYDGKILNTPIRLIFQDTKNYYSWHSNNNFLDDEKKQLERGDIPYFFNSLADRKPKYFKSNDEYVCSISAEEKYSEMLARRSFSIDLLLDKVRLKTVILPIGILYVSKFLLKNFKNYSLEFSGYKLSKNNDIVTFEDNVTVYNAKVG